MESSQLAPSRRSRIGLDATNFFVAEVSGVAVPFLNAFLRSCRWRYDAIGTATALAGLGVLLMQAPAGFIVDCARSRRQLLAAASLALGACYGLLPVAPARWWVVDPLVFMAGLAQAFFPLLLGALALGLVGRARLTRTFGANQAWNHAGNIAAALVAMGLVAWFGLRSVFFAVGAASLLAAGSVFLIRRRDLDEGRVGVVTTDREPTPTLASVLSNPRVVMLLASTAVFHLANAPVMPLVALYIKHQGGSDVAVAAVVLVAQLVMIPVALGTGWLCEAWGRKPILAIGFSILPLRILLYTLARDPQVLVGLQALDGIGAGIFGVAIVAMCADVTRGRGHFSALLGLTSTAVSLGGVVGPVAAGLLVQHLGFVAAFEMFAGIAGIAAAMFVFGVRESSSGGAVRPLESAVA